MRNGHRPRTGRSTATLTTWRPTFPVCSQPAMCGTAPLNAVRLLWAKEPWQSPSSIGTSPAVRLVCFASRASPIDGAGTFLSMASRHRGIHKEFTTVENVRHQKSNRSRCGIAWPAIASELKIQAGWLGLEARQIPDGQRGSVGST